MTQRRYVMQRGATAALLVLLGTGCTFDPSGVAVGGGGNPDPENDGGAPMPQDAAGPGVDAGPCSAPAGLCGYGWRRQITLDNTGVTERLDDVPVLLALDRDRIDYMEMARQDGGDLRFWSGDLTEELAYEIEYWEPLGQSFVWVEVPRIEPEGQASPVIWMYYGNPQAQPGQRPADVWRNGYVSVHHFHNVLADSTGQGHDATSTAAPTPTVASQGIIAGAMSFDGTSQFLELPQEDDFDFTKDLSISVWIRVESFSFDYQTIVAKGDGAWRLHRHQTNDRLAFDNDEDGASATNHGGSIQVDDGQWHFVLATYDGSKKELYVDDKRDFSRNYSGTISRNDFPVAIGDNNEFGSPRFFHGLIDEVRISREPRSQSWGLVQYRAATDPAFATFGPAEQP